MKKVIALVVCLMLALGSTGAFAAQLATTQAFMDVAEREGLIYSYIGMDDDGDENLVVDFDGENFAEISMNVFFSGDLEDVSIYVWNLVDFDAELRAEALDACNTANTEYKYVKFRVDDSDNSVTAVFNYRLSDVSASAEIVYEMICRVANIIDSCYEYFAPIL